MFKNLKGMVSDKQKFIEAYGKEEWARLAAKFTDLTKTGEFRYQEFRQKVGEIDDFVWTHLGTSLIGLTYANGDSADDPV